MDSDDFKAKYHAYFGKFPADLEIRSENRAWTPFILDIRDEEADKVMMAIIDLGIRKPYLGALRGALGKIRREAQGLRPSDHHMTPEDAKTFELAATPAWDLSGERPRMRRRMFTRDLPETNLKELTRIKEAILVGRVERESVRDVTKDLFRPDWQDYTEEEQEIHRRIWRSWGGGK